MRIDEGFAAPVASGSSGFGLREVTVSPAAIDRFAQLLSGQVSDELAQLQQLVEALQQRDDFGSYDRSATARERYRAIATQRRDHALELRRTAASLADATRAVASGYRAVEETNATGASSVGSMLA